MRGRELEAKDNEMASLHATLAIKTRALAKGAAEHDALMQRALKAEGGLPVLVQSAVVFHFKGSLAQKPRL